MELPTKGFPTERLTTNKGIPSTLSNNPAHANPVVRTSEIQQSRQQRTFRHLRGTPIKLIRKERPLAFFQMVANSRDMPPSEQRRYKTDIFSTIDCRVGHPDLTGEILLAELMPQPHAIIEHREIIVLNLLY